MPAALLTAKLSAEVRMCLRGNLDPERVVAQLNRPFDGGGMLDMYITFMLVVLDVETHRLSVVNAGHPCPLDPPARRPTGGIRPVRLRPAAGNHAEYAYECAETILEPGETVVLYTDGVTDAMDANGDRLGEAQLRDSLLSRARGSGRRR